MENGSDRRMRMLEAQLRHLQNELRLTREEYAGKARNYFELYSRMEQLVEERTSSLRELQRNLELKNRQLEIIFDSSRVMIFSLNESREFIRVNRRFMEFFRLPITDIVGRSCSDFMPLCGDLFENVQEIMKTGAPVLNQECRIDGPTGRRDLIVDKVPCVDQDGTPLGIIGFASDVTDLKNAEEEKRALQQRVLRAEKMEAIGLLAGGVAHDGNNILTGICGYIELLNMKIPEDDPRRKYIDGTLEASRKMARLIDDLLTLTRGIVTEKVIINLNDEIRDYVNSPMFRSLKSMHAGVRVEAHLDEELMNIEGVSAHIIKMIMNLVTNAAESMSDGGTVSLSTYNREIVTPVDGYDLRIEEGRYAVFRVEDTGSGIDESDINRVFEPFFTTKKSGASGTGLGMALVYGIVKDHHGFIDIDSEKGRGTTFTVYFPATDAPVERKGEEPVIGEMNGQGQRILVVEDVKAQRDLLAELLSRLGYLVDSVPSGEDAVAYLEKGSADLVILDMVMEPGMDGLDTYRKIIETHPRQKAIIASGYSQTARVVEAQRLGAGQYVKKPYTLEKIGTAVRKELSARGV
jgi:two-component system cell cycle sensor histidine kinase/response regulator CckA